MRTLMVVSVVTLGFGCGDDGVSVSGTDPVADAEEVTNELCSKEADCGDWDINCTTTNNVTDCTALRQTVSFEECRSDNLADTLEAFTCAGTLTKSEADLVNRCVNKLAGQSCISQSEIDAYVLAIERGEDPASLRPDPAECDALEPIFERCR